MRINPNIRVTSTCAFNLKSYTLTASLRTFDSSMFYALYFYSGTCFETFHLYVTRKTLKNGETGKATIAIQRYGRNSCRSATGCGPNFCCCNAHNGLWNRLNFHQKKKYLDSCFYPRRNFFMLFGQISNFFLQIRKEDGRVWRTKCPFNTEYRLWVRRLKSALTFWQFLYLR